MLDTVGFRENRIYGFGGAGKTQTSREYCGQRGENYDRIFWLSCQHQYSLGQISEEVADGLLCKGDRSNFLCSPTSFFLAQVICLLKGVRQRCYGFIPEAHGPHVMDTTNLIIGDGEIGPQAGQQSLGREDDDDDDCVGFQRFSRPGQSSQMDEEGAPWHDRLKICNLDRHSLCATIPKYGPPKHDPVAAAMSEPVRQFLDASTLSTWRDVISRTCGEGADLYPAKAKLCQGSSWEGGGIGTNCSNRSAGFFLRVH
jgi:hypothetical protein